MIATDNTITSAAARTASAAGPASAATSADFQSFLTLLTAQLRHQDPLSPLDSTQFVAQLASFSTVEELVNANARLDQIASGLSGAGIDRYASWIGREAEARGAPLLFDGAPTPLRAEADASADHVELVIRDAAGNVVHRAPIANTGEILIWDGSTTNGVASPGAYRASA
ncbi:MAG: flagellar hook assembly protein FlgD, partial [Pseudomonadota bacterium]